MVVCSSPPRCAGDNGAALVEAAFITPLFFYLIFSVIEFGMLFFHYQTVGHVALSSARTASVIGKDYLADYKILQSVKNFSATLNTGDIANVVVWHAATGESTIPFGCASGTSSSAVGSECNAYTVTDFVRPQSDFDGTVTAPDRFWPGKTRKDGNSTADFIGVYIHYNHRWLTGLYGANKTIVDTSVLRIEPHSQT